MQTKLISITHDVNGKLTPEELLAYIARVSSSNQENPNYTDLFTHCILNNHWSVFEHVFMTIEIQTSVAIATQILRHRSAFFQMFSQRYSQVLEFEEVELRNQAIINRQSSTDVRDDIETKVVVGTTLDRIKSAYQFLLNTGVAKECARFILPQTTMTKLYFTGNVRTWLHYLLLRTEEHTQREHQDVATSCADLFRQEFPFLGKVFTAMQMSQTAIDLYRKTLIYSCLGNKKYKETLKQWEEENKKFL